jgi:hypothetical protein
MGLVVGVHNTHMRLVVGPLGLGLDLIFGEGDGPANEVARTLYVVKSDDGTLLRVYRAFVNSCGNTFPLEIVK